MKSEMLAEPVLVGRERELEKLQKYLKSAVEGKGETVFISGEAGSGKTRLLKEFLRLLNKNEVVVLMGWCLSEAPVPYFPFMEAFDSCLFADSGQNATSFSQRMSLRSWLLETNKPEASEKSVGIQSQIWRDHAFYGVANELLFLSSKKPLVLVLDDIHWADSASLSLLHYLARQLASERILILATFRSEELCQKSEGHPQSLSKTLLLMDRDDLHNEMKLSNLEVSDVSKIVESMLCGKVQFEFAKKLTYESQGNPLFVVEYLRMLYQQGKLVKEHGQWDLIGALETPKKVKDVVRQRLEGLSPNERKILDVASIIGENFDPQLVATVVSQDNADVFRTLTEIAKNTLIINCEGKSCRFGHTKFREMLYTEIPSLLRKEYHLRVAERIEADSKGLPDAPLSDLAYHFVRAENKLKAIKYSLGAGKVAISRFSNVEAIQQFSYVVNSVIDYPELINEKLSALEDLGTAFYASSMFKEATRTFEELGETAESSVVKLRAFRKAMESAFQHGDPLRLLELVKKAEPYAAADRLENARVLSCRSRAFMLQRKINYIKDLEDALQVFEEEYSLWDVAWALMGVGNYHAAWGRKEHQGLAEALRSIALFEELGDFPSQMETLFVAGYDFMGCLLYDEALDVYEKMISMNENMKMGNYLHACNAYAWSGVLFSSYMGDLEKGLSYNLKALEISKKTDSLVTQGVVFSNLVRLYVLLGDIKQAEEYFQKLMKLPPEIFNFTPVNGDFTRAIFLAGKGQWKTFEDLRERLKASQFPGWSLAVERHYVWVLKRQGRVEEAKIHLEELKRIRREAEKKFEHATVLPSFMVRRHVTAGEEVEIRLDLVNVARNPGTLTRVEALIPSGSRIVTSPSFCSIQNSSINMNNKRINPFQVETIKLRAVFDKTGVYKYEPSIFYFDDLNENRVCAVKPINITAKSSPPKNASENVVRSALEFTSEASKRAFNFLINSFEEDYSLLKLPQEKSGWRTLMQVVKQGHVTRHSMYGQMGRGGQTLAELKRLGLIETRFFDGERGRGGKIAKIRIRYDKEIKRFV
jgi:tetratricopeptide (TPR) repeat protein